MVPAPGQGAGPRAWPGRTGDDVPAPSDMNMNANASDTSAAADGFAHDEEVDLGDTDLGPADFARRAAGPTARSSHYSRANASAVRTSPTSGHEDGGDARGTGSSSGDDASPVPWSAEARAGAPGAESGEGK
jgi:hypothetical protein